MTEKRYIVNIDCLCNEVLDIEFAPNGVDKPSKEEIEDKDYLIVCDIYPKSVADKLCERLNRYENENKKFKVENEQLKSKIKELQVKYNKQLVDYNGLGCEYDWLKEENERLKKDKFICLDCKHSGYTEIGCLCEKEDCWIEYKTKCKDYEELE